MIPLRDPTPLSSRSLCITHRARRRGQVTVHSERALNGGEVPSSSHCPTQHTHTNTYSAPEFIKYNRTPPLPKLSPPPHPRCPTYPPPLTESSEQSTRRQVTTKSPDLTRCTDLHPGATPACYALEHSRRNVNWGNLRRVRERVSRRCTFL